MSSFDREKFLIPIAHRGLHDERQGRIENTAPSFLAAIQHGFGIECDIRPAALSRPVVFHDPTTERLLDETRTVADLTQDDLARLRYRDGKSAILTFDEFLQLVEGRVPLLVEIKSEWSAPDAVFLKEVIRLIRAYSGPLALMSFDPAILSFVRALEPTIPRGMIAAATGPEDPLARIVGAERASDLSNLLESGPPAPDCYAYRVCDLPTPVTRYAREIHGRPFFAWTVRSPEDFRTAARWADAPIFEGLLPPERMP
ncbi:Glycerophosphoryl diester phosphodiesterase [Filomicrobium insigne]|uniref:Glycerophosphoryl diester phosphodiesterase n=1 Tax=Filomicrobium insigne TaxID=418854 RepID=A0A1H0LCM8_9HYPH|nr:glycerophosphodiester phosphodiesterase family protein [Filomicrobium insigne]SDO65832.1 Glycerophosphoryl diester phosphodiesterase [Filomicrobium insigne]